MNAKQNIYILLNILKSQVHIKYGVSNQILS